ncbi:RNA polymerase sigma-70 factor [Paraflavisolibacter sp. H34]|uniref:RNA polymerase sigma-70 factor n=1 Tax=Huijunlia imazamoxiresistens TaxID=3127457 RepID=UPI0030181C74
MNSGYIRDHNGDEVCFRDIRTGDAPFERFFKQEFTAVCAWCQYKFGFDLDDAKEIVHTGFIKVWGARQEQPDSQPVKAFLYRVVTNSSLDLLKHQKVKQKHERYVQQMGDAVTADSFDAAGLQGLEAAVEAAIAALPEQMRRIFILSRYEELKYAQIAQQLGISVKTVETQMSRALAKLRTALSGYLLTFLLVLAFCLFLKK